MTQGEFLDIDDDKRTEHESYGLLSISRRQGGRSHLFGSAVEHHNTIALTISRAEHVRNLSHDWYRDTDQLIEVEMSPAQFAEAITTLNHGCGVPCTIRHLQGHPNIQEPPFESIRETFHNEFKEDMEKIAGRLVDDMREIEKVLEKKALNKADREMILKRLSMLHQEVKSNLPFVHKSFDEAVDKTVVQAKAEVEAFFTNAMIKAGQAALAGAPVEPVQVPLLDFQADNPPGGHDTTIDG